MKKLLSLIVVVCMLVSVFAISSSAATITTAEQSLLKLGNADANKDGSISVADVKLYLEAAAGIAPENASYDVDLDGVTSISDAVTVLKESAGVASVLTKAEALELFNNSVNLIKSTAKADGVNPVEGALPGFEKTTTVQCRSMLITTSGAPLASLNVTNKEYRDYVDTIVKTMEPLSGFLDDEMKEDLEEMKASKTEAYKPKSSVETAAAGDDVGHVTLYPINNVSHASKLTVDDDVSSVTCTLNNNHIVYTITMGTTTYTGNQYPTGATGFSGRLDLSYGKAFNLMSFDESDGSTLNKITYKDGKIVLIENAQTGKPVEAHYSYTYVSDISAPENQDLKMKTVMTSDVKEDFIFN